MTQTTDTLHGSKPFFRADQVGSLLRPQYLLDARDDLAAGKIDPAQLRAIEDAAIRDAVRMQESVGLKVVTDGEFRRENWWIDFISKIPGVKISDGSGKNPSFERQEDHSFQYVPKNVFTAEKLTHEQSIVVPDYEVVASATHATAKVTIPSPTRMHFHGGRACVSAEAYPDIESFFSDVAKIYREEIAALEKAGCRYIQIDDPILTYFLSKRLREEIASNGEEPMGRLRRYVQLVNDCIADRRSDTAVGIHLCRGNSKSGWISEGGYEGIAEAAFAGLKVDSFFLEYDDERSGDFHPLRFVPQDKKVVLGLVTTKYPQLEVKDTLKRRIDEASKYVGVERLAISPQCGFASVVEGNIITPEDQLRKLGLVVETAQEVWGAG